jgi:hypothetical protein
MMCARGVSQDLFPVRTRFGRNCQIPHFGAAHLGTLQGVTAHWIIAVPPIIGSKHGRGATPAGPLGGFQRAFFRPSVGPSEAPCPMKPDCLTVGSTRDSLPGSWLYRTKHV